MIKKPYMSLTKMPDATECGLSGKSTLLKRKLWKRTSEMLSAELSYKKRVIPAADDPAR